MGRFTEIGIGSLLLNITLGYYSYCERYCDLANAEIGKLCNIASFVRVGPTDYPMNRVSLHHFLYRSNRYWPESSEDTQFFQITQFGITKIRNDTWIRHGAIIKSELKIGDGAIIGAGSIVTKDVEPYSIVAGNQALLIRRRFDKQTAKRIIKLGWWDWSHEQLGSCLKDFRNLDVGSFLNKYEYLKGLRTEKTKVILNPASYKIQWAFMIALFYLQNHQFYVL